MIVVMPTKIENGYLYIKTLNHPKTTIKRGCWIKRTTLIAEGVLGRYLKDKECVHHIDGNRLNDEKANLIICQNTYHRIIHTRTKAYKACGHVDWVKCWICNQWDELKNLYSYQTGSGVHPKCNSQRTRERINNRRLKCL